MKGVIIAAGDGSRLWPETNRTPKSLLPFKQDTILSCVIKNLSNAGVDDFIIVLGFKSQMIIEYLRKNDLLDFKISTVLNSDFKRGNGTSVLKAYDLVGDDDFILSMSDHIVSPSAIRRVVEKQGEKNYLLVDRRVDENFDIDDATKVLAVERKIVDIGKSITKFNCIDCGIFKLKSSFMRAMNEQIKVGEESISLGVKKLIEKKLMEAVFMENKETWIDIDTPKAYRFALDNFCNL
ncbi:NTP transferase domain-containing protein [candidate division WOR-3 bacterium]|nr:NTP transferase domain-containing protein [candidate division WOR-3 bacterium]